MKIIDFSLSKNQPKAFGGAYNGYQRYDYFIYPKFKNIEQNMRGAFWTPEEISLERDRIKFPELPEHIQTIFKKNIVFQTLMDSGQNRGVDNVLSQLATLPEIEAALKTHAYFELIHSLSYSHIIREMFPLEATKIFDELFKDKRIQKRMEKEIRAFNRIGSLRAITVDGLIDGQESFVSAVSEVVKLENSKKYYESLKKELQEKSSEINRKLKQELVELILRIYALESLKFYVSFLITYVINYSFSNAIPGATRIIKLINFDEDKHVAVMKNIIDVLKVEEDFRDILSSDWFERKCTEIFVEVVEDEINWGKYLLSIGYVPSLSEQVIEMFVKYYADKRLKFIGIPPVFGQASFDVVEWFELYKDPNKDNTAQQEGESISYNIGALIDDL